MKDSRKLLWLNYFVNKEGADAILLLHKMLLWPVVLNITMMMTLFLTDDFVFNLHEMT